MNPKNKKNAACGQPDAEPRPYITARFLGHEINREFLTLSIPNETGGFSRVRMRVPKRLAHFYKKNALVRVTKTADPLVVEPFPSFL
jgi:hypothetical protein